LEHAFDVHIVCLQRNEGESRAPPGGYEREKAGSLTSSALSVNMSARFRGHPLLLCTFAFVTENCRSWTSPPLFFLLRDMRVSELLLKWKYCCCVHRPPCAFCLRGGGLRFCFGSLRPFGCQGIQADRTVAARSVLVYAGGDGLVPLVASTPARIFLYLIYHDFAKIYGPAQI
jgi:hypothetical protein